MNPCQICVLQLKIAATKVLDYPAYVSFIGLVQGDADERVNTYQTKVAPLLDPTYKAFWDERLLIIRQGVLYR